MVRIFLIIICLVFSLSSQAQSAVNIDFNTPTTDLTYNGSAYQDTTNGYIVLTPNAKTQSGSVWYNTPLSIDQFSTTFDFYLGNNTSGGDGITFAVIDASTGLNALGVNGEGLGYKWISGKSFAVEFDTYYNWGLGDPVANHVGIDQNGSVASLATNSSIPILEDGTLHTAQIVFNAGNIKTYVDNVLYLDYSISNYPTQGYIGFTGSTGGWTNLQYVDNWTVNVAPEPISSALFITGGILLAGRNYLKRRKGLI